MFESLEVETLDPGEELVRLRKSPLLVRNLAAGDKLRVRAPVTASYDLIQRSGNLCIRVYRKQQLSTLADFLSPEIEKLDGSLDLQTDRALVYSIHYTIGFAAIEALLNRACEEYPGTVWYYGNVYDPADGVSPLLWWENLESESQR